MKTLGPSRTRRHGNGYRVDNRCFPDAAGLSHRRRAVLGTRNPLAGALANDRPKCSRSRARNCTLECAT
ncbi:unnamed protein product, partial [Iphiclides podalirius]